MKPVVKTSTPKDLTTPYQQELTSFTDSLQVALRLDTIIDQFVFHAYKPGLVTFSYRYVIVSQNLSQVHSDRLEELEGVIISRLRLTAPAIRPVENIQVIFQGHGWPVIREGVYRASDHFQKRRPL